ncbi:hypothetical protein STCU_06478 [Strigomonas culicis]|uniref:Uncharacterized protein n=1 Tax=Strigomonas culicis TaxID=28005 RepID=S9VRG0_9TRYP|nr:hypothetical protein STCU_06478 [Strigomonas culicis]|eukprot:EPY25785.1 hypothetical protein STCU_06478 [Strigomonas culicis]
MSKPGAPGVLPTFGLQSSRITVRKGIAGDSSEDNGMQLVFFDLGGAPCFLPLLDVVPSRRVTYILTFSLVTRGARGAPGGDADSASPAAVQPAAPSLQLFKTTLELILGRTDNRDVSILLVATQADLFLRYYRDEAAQRSPGARQAAGRQEMQDAMRVVEREVETYLQLLQPNAAMRPVIVGRFAVDSVHAGAAAPRPKPQPWSPFEKHTKAPAPIGQDVYSFDFANVKSWRELLWWLSDHAHQCCRRDVDFSNGLVPARCFTHLEDVLQQIRQTHKWCLPAADYRQLAKSVHPHYKAARSDLHAQTQLLQSFGVLHHAFRHARLKKYVILDTAWLYQLWSVLAACGFVTVQGAAPDSAAAAIPPIPVPSASGARAVLAGGAQHRQRVVLLATPEALTSYASRPSQRKGEVRAAAASLPFDAAHVAVADKYHLLPQGALSFSVLSVLLTSLTRQEAVGGRAAAVAARRKTSSFAQLPDLLGVVEFLEMCDWVIRGSRVRFSSFRANPNPFTLNATANGGGPTPMRHKGLVVPADSLNASSSTATSHATTPVVTVRGRIISPALDANRPPQPSATTATTAERTERPPLECRPSAPLAPFRGAQPTSAWETFLLLPSNFQQRPPSCVVLHFSKFLSGPFYRFRLRIAPLCFFSKLVARLAADVELVRGVYVGPLHAQPVLAESPAIPLSSFSNDAGAEGARGGGGRRSLSTGSPTAAAAASAAPSLAGVVPTATSCATLWQHTVWVVGHGSCRAFVRMIGHTLFVSFHAHPQRPDSARPDYAEDRTDDEMDGFYDAVVATVRQVVEENPGVECEESLFCAAGYDVVWQTTEARLFAAKHGDGGPAAVDERDEEIDITTSDEQREHVFYRAIDENLNTLQKIRERDTFALQTARSRQLGRERGPQTPLTPDNVDGRRRELAGLLGRDRPARIRGRRRRPTPPPASLSCARGRATHRRSTPTFFCAPSRREASSG